MKIDDLKRMRNAIIAFDLPEIRRLVELEGYELDYVDSKHTVCALIYALESEFWQFEKNSTDTMDAPITKMLLEYGANPNTPCGEGRLPLDYAMDLWSNLREGSPEPECVTLLKMYGAKASQLP